MRSVIYDRYGGPEVLKVIEADKPKISENKLLVRVKASSVNPIDYKVRRGDMKILSGKKFPKFAGSDFAGIIEEAGGSVGEFKKGDEVYGFVSALKGGAFSDYLIVDAAKIALKPEKFSYEQSASMPTAALTALQALNYLGNVVEGSSVLINGATGGVGSFGVQIAKVLGAHVTGTCSKKNVNVCKKLGSAEVFDYSLEDMNNSGKKFDVFFDAAGRSTFWKSKKFLKRGGVYITTIPGPGVFLSRLLNFIPFKKKAKFILVRSSSIDLTLLAGFVMTDMVKPLIGNSFKLEDIEAAHKKAENGNFTGKIVIKI